MNGKGMRNMCFYQIGKYVMLPCRLLNFIEFPKMGLEPKKLKMFLLIATVLIE